MPIVLAMIFILCAWATDGAIPNKICADLLIDVTPSFDSELRLDASNLSVTFRGVSFKVSPSEYYLLQMILTSPVETVAYDDLLVSLYGENEPEWSLSSVHVFAHHLRKKFMRVDAAFDNLKARKGHGMYWARVDHEKIVVKRVGAAKYIDEGYVDGRGIPLMGLEHKILTALLRRNLVSATTVRASSQDTFEVMAGTLNRKFQPLLGERLIERGPYGLGAYQLHRNLRRAPDASTPPGGP